MNSEITKEVLNHHLTAFGNNDIVGIMKDYTETSEVLTVEGPVKGRDNIENLFKDLFAVIPVGSAFEMKQLTVIGSVAYIVWSSESKVAKIPFGVDSFFLEGDKIKYHTLAMYKHNS